MDRSSTSWSRLHAGTPLILAAVLLLLGSILSNVAFGQTRTPYGRRFLVPIPDTIGCALTYFKSPVKDAAWLVIFAQKQASVTITGSGSSRTLTVQPASSTTIPLPTLAKGSPFLRAVATPSRELYEVRSDQPVAVTCFVMTTQGAEAFSPFPVERWGKEYYAMGLAADMVSDVQSVGDEKVRQLPHSAPAELVIVAAEDKTDVRIEATTDIGGARTRTVTLNAGEAYMVRTPMVKIGDNTTRDLSGTHIVASKPVGLLSGNTRSSGHDRAANGCDTRVDNTTRNTLLEWMPSVEEGGTSFAYCGDFQYVNERPFSFCSPPVDVVRVYGIAPGTTVVRDVANNVTVNVQQGGYTEFVMASAITGRSRRPFQITSDKPTQAIHITPPYSDLTSSIDSWGTSMATMPPAERWLVSARFRAPDTPSAMSHYVVLAAEQNATVWLDGKVVNATPVQVTAPYRYWVLPVTIGDHRIESEGGKFSAMAYGFEPGYEWYRPAKAQGGDNSGLLHPSTYEEVLGASYSYAILGLEVLPADSLMVSPPRFACGDTLAYLEITNGYRRSVKLAEVKVDPAGMFIPNLSGTPGTLRPDATARIPVSLRVGSSTMRADGLLTIRITDPATGRTIGVATDSLAWRRTTYVATTSMPRDYLGMPGDTVPVTVVLDKPLDSAHITDFTIRLGYNGTVVRPVLSPTDSTLTGMLHGTLLDGWRATPRIAPGELLIDLKAPAGAELHGSGILLTPRMATFVGTSDTSEVELELRGAGGVCLTNEAKPGLVRLQMCGLASRLFEFVAGQYFLRQNVPDPVADRTRIDFAIAFEGDTRLEIFDMEGSLRAVPLNEHLSPGTYSVEIEGSSLSPGAYYYRITSGEWTQTRRMVVQR